MRKNKIVKIALLLIVGVAIASICIFLLPGCTQSVHHSPKAGLELEINRDSLPLSKNLVFTEEFLRENHCYIRFHYRYSDGQVSDAVVHDPECVYCATNLPVEVQYNL